MLRGLLFFALVAPGLALTVPNAAQMQQLRDQVAEINALLGEYWKLGNRITDEFYQLSYAEMEALRAQRGAIAEKLKGKAQATITQVDIFYSLEAEGKNSPAEPLWDITVQGQGHTTSDGVVHIGPFAFKSVEVLVHTKLHEFVHADQAATQKWPEKGDDKAEDLSELEAYKKELAIASTTRLSAEDKADVEARIAKIEEGLSETNLARAKAGNYVAEATPLGEALERKRVEMKLEGKGVAAGDVFTAHLRRTAPGPFVLEIVGGTPICPDRAGVQTMMVAHDVFVPLNQPEVTVNLPGYCLIPGLPPPPKSQDVVWSVANPCEQPKLYQPAQRTIRAGRRLSEAGRFHTDMPAAKYRDTVIQRALWNLADPEGWGKERLKADLIKQVRDSGGQQTPEQIQQLTDHLWEDVDLTLKSR